MANAYIAYSGKKGVIKLVSVETGGEIDELGIQLLDYFKDLSDVKELITTAIRFVEDGVAEYIGGDLDEQEEDDYVFELYDNKDDLINYMVPAYYYLFDNDEWYVMKPNHEEFKALETVMEEEY